ncbi:hypothetical protein EI555_006962, partial [Monodon monoceros]
GSVRLNMQNHEPGDTIREKLTTCDIITRNVSQVPEEEMDLLEHGSTCLGLNATLCGLRTVFLKLFATWVRISARLPMAVISFWTVHVPYKDFVSLPLTAGGLNCGRCTVTWYIPWLILVFGDLLPLFLVIPLNGGFVARYNSSLFPEKEVA